MAQIINLRSVKKARDRLEKRAQGDENAAKFGRTKAQKQLEAATAEKARRTVDAHQRDTAQSPQDGISPPDAPPPDGPAPE